MNHVCCSAREVTSCVTRAASRAAAVRSPSAENDHILGTAVPNRFPRWEVAPPAQRGSRAALSRSERAQRSSAAMPTCESSKQPVN